VAKLRRVIWLTFALAISVIVLGAYTRLTEAGLSCPDWPGCYGQIGVPMSPSDQIQAQSLFPNAPLEVKKAWNEMIHRYLAGTLGLSVVLVNILGWKHANFPRFLGGSLIFLVIGQATLGMLTVTEQLMPVVVMGHLLGGFTLLVLLLWLGVSLSPYSQRHYQVLGQLPWWVLVGVFLQIALGGWTAANYAALVCQSLPICEMGWWSRFDVSAFSWPAVAETYQYGTLGLDQRVSIHVSHRIGAFVVSILVIWLAIRTWQVSAYSAFILLFVLMMQVSLGVLNVVWQLPLWTAVLHNLVGAILLVNVARLAWVSWSPVVRYFPKEA
jgi:cytochrome c oxidase assembly protein subunit 15